MKRQAPLQCYHGLAVAMKRRGWSVVVRPFDADTVAHSQFRSSPKISFFTAMGSSREEARAGARGADPNPLSLPSNAALLVCEASSVREHGD